MSCGKHFSAFQASSGKNFSAVSSAHSGSESVNFFSLSSLRLERSDHILHPLFFLVRFCAVFRARAVLRAECRKQQIRV